MISDPCDHCSVGTYSELCKHFCAAHRRAVERDTERVLAQYQSDGIVKRIRRKQVSGR